ncbi:hypothetical protein BH10PSE19_BH10PSE19_08660 [soil metagenome]
MKSALSMNSKAILSSKGQVVIPKVLREKLGMHTGNELIFRARAGGVIEIRPLTRSIDMFFGRCKKAKTKILSIEDMDAAIASAVLENMSDCEEDIK